MNKYYYFPILKTKPSEMKAYINILICVTKNLMIIVKTNHFAGIK